jgi:arylsulfatase A-like enzyme
VQWSVSSGVVTASGLAADTALIIEGNIPWTDSGIDVVVGESLMVSAQGSLAIGRSAKGKWDEPRTVGPEGTFLYSEKVAEKEFPLASGASGPAPCFCLIGRVGESEPFFIGKGRSWKPTEGGRLYLGINDFETRDNKGEFLVSVEKLKAVAPIAFEEVVPIDARGGDRVPGCSVVVFYIDGLRPDVVREMAAMGHIPNINRVFIEGGAWLNNAFTAFPSDTITSNGTMWTGCFSDRHGLKGQVCFSRRTLTSQSYLEPLGPSRSARLLAPQGIDKFLHETGAASVNLVDGEQASQRWRRQHTSGVPPLFEHLRQNGSDWSTGVLPMMTEIPPVLWTRSLSKYLPYLQSNESWKYIDDANTDFAKNFLFERDTPVTIVWLPETDSISHKSNRGQFGATRRTIAKADALVGQMVDEIAGRHRLDRTYFILCSDHGHHGGRSTHLSHFDIADEFFHKTRIVSPDGRLIGGGLGLSVQQHRFWNRHPEDRSNEFVFVDADSDGASRIYLPNGHFRSGVWSGKLRPANLLAYRISDNIAPVNLIESLTSLQAPHGSGTMRNPVDLVLVKLTDDSILISTHDRGHAVIHRKRNELGKWVYKYTPVEKLQATVSGEIAYHEVSFPETDPLGLVEHLHPRLLTYYHDEMRWLRMTATSNYPDSVVALTRHMLWQENLSEQELEHAPDLVVTAGRGWFFGTKASPGTMHGYPFPGAMHASFFVAGPNVRQGARIEEPCRLADLTPTILDMIGYPVETGDFDGRPLRNVYKPSTTEVAETRTVAHAEVEATDTRAVYWDDVDLKAWNKLAYNGLPEYEHLPLTMNHPNSPIDINNVAYTILSLWDLSVIRIFDDVLSPLENGRPMIMQTAEWVEAKLRHSTIQAIADAADALDITSTGIGDYNWYSVGNIKRADGTIDWVQKRANRVDRCLANRMGRTQTPGARVVNKIVDGIQCTFWEGYRFGQRIIAELLDEQLLNSIENTTDRTINSFREQPAEVVVDPFQTPQAQRDKSSEAR